MATVREGLIKLLGGIDHTEHENELHRATARAYEQAIDDANDEPASGDLSSYGYRRSTGTSIRELGDLDYAKIQDIAWRVFLLSPVAKRYLQLKRDYELGRGFAPRSDDEAFQELIKAFWADNQLTSRLKQYVLQWHLLGEQLFPVFVRATDGRVRLGYIDPAEIERVITDPENVLSRVAVVLKRYEATNDAWLTAHTEHRIYRVVRADDDIAQSGRVIPSAHPGRLVTHTQAELADWEHVMLNQYGLDAYTGSCIYWARNALSNQTRGYTDLLQVADWIDQTENCYFDLAQRENLAGYFFADVTLAGATEEQVHARAAELARNPPKKGSVRVHNDSEAWDLTAPDLKQQPSIETGKDLLTFVLGGMGIPRHFYGYGDETNRATAQAQGDPTWKTMQNDQDAVRDLCLVFCQLARDQAIIAGRPISDEAQVHIDLPDMTTKDTAGISTALGTLSTALMVAQDRGWLTQNTTAAIFAMVASELGVQVDSEREIAEVLEQGEQGDIAQAGNANQWLRDHGVVVELPDQAPVSAGSYISKFGAPD